MKTRHFSTKIVLFLLLGTASLAAQEKNHTIRVVAPKFAQLLVKSWIAAYENQHPEASVELIENQATAVDATLRLVVASGPDSTSAPKSRLATTARLALLPAANAGNPYFARNREKNFNKKEIEQLFFESDLDEEEETGKKQEKLPTVYTAENPAKLSGLLAGHYGRTTSELKGKKVLGDDIYLVTALRKDTTALSYNSLNYLYDLNTRLLKSGLALLPLKMKKDEKQRFYGNADELINLLEINAYETIPVLRIGFEYNPSNLPEGASSFLQWTLAEGQGQNHKLGFLQVDELDRLTAERELASERLLSIK